MNDIEFERIISYCPKDSFMVQQPCLRDLVFNYFEEEFSADRANRFTKVYLDELYAKMVHRKA